MTKARDLGDFISDGTIAETVTADGLNLGDNETIQLGDGQDLLIWHSGNNSHIRDAGTGNLLIQTNGTAINMQGTSGENYAIFNDNGAVTLNYDNSLKFSTSATGATVTGTIAVSDSFNATSGTFTVQSNGTDILNLTSTVMSPQTDGAISLGSATNGFNNMYLDGSAYVGGNVIINSTANTPLLRFDESDAAKFFIGESSVVGGGAGYDLYAGTGDGISLFTNASEVMRITSAGNVGIGTTSPDSFNTTGGKLVVASGAGNVAALFSDAAYYTLGVKHTGVGTEAFGMFGGTAGSGLALMTNNTERFRFGTSGELGIGGATYGTAGQVLTSGGSGAAPTWADAAGGGSARDFVASGTIANGNVVKLNTDGTVSVTSASEFVSDGTFAYNSTNQWSNYEGVYDATNNQVIIGFKNPDASNHPHYVIGEISGDQITFGTPVSLQSSVCYDVNVTFGHSGNVLIGWNQAGQTYNVYSYSIQKGSLTEIGGDNTPDTPLQRDKICKLIWLPTIDSVLAVYVTGSYLTTAVWSINSSSLNISYQGRDFMVGSPNDLYQVRAAYDSSQDVTNFIWYNGSNGYAYLKNVKVSSSYVFSAVLTNYNWNTSNGPAHDIVYHPTAQKCFILYRKQSDSTTNLKTVTNSGTTSITVGSETQVDNTLGYINFVKAAYNSAADEVILSGQFPNSSSHGYVIRIGWSSGSPVISSPTKWLSQNTRDWPQVIPADGTRNYIVYNNYVSSYDIYSVLYDTAKTAVGYGVANASVTNGQSVEVISIGSIADNQSGLTIGTKYYYADAGSLSTSGTLQAGIAVSATELLITGADT